MSAEVQSSQQGPVTAFISGADSSALSSAYSLEGVAGFVEGRARAAIQQALSKEGSEWLCDAFADAINKGRSSGSRLDFSALFKQDAELKARVAADLKTRIKEWLPKQARDIIVRDLLGNAIGEEHLKEAAEIADRVVREFNMSLNERIDAAATSMYDSAIKRLKEQMSSTGMPLWIDPTDMRGTLHKAFNVGTIADSAALGLSQIIGDGTVAAIRGRIEDALGGSLPPEAIEALKAGPEAFERYAARAQQYFPGNSLNKLQSSLLNQTLFRLPTPAYAAILAGTAAGHYARAFSGPVVDAYELKRAVEVTRVMVWQIQNKQWLNMTIMQLASLARGLAASIGAGASFDAALAKIKEPLSKLQGELDNIDALLAKPIDQVRGELDNIVGSVEDELKYVQNQLTDPLRDGIAKFQDGLDSARELAEGALPDGLGGLPANWDELKKLAGIDEGLLGKPGDWRPSDALRGVTGKVKRDLADLNERAAELVSQGAAGVLEAAHMLGPAAAILDVERSPARNPSRESALDPVLLHNGEYVQSVTDIVIPGRGLDFRFMRTYRGRSDFLGELGWRWTHNFAERLLPWNDGGREGLTYIDEEGRKSFFAADGVAFISPPGVYSKLTRVSDGYELTAREGVVTKFDAQGVPLSKRDRNNNQISYEYDDRGLLSAVIDALGRRIEFARRADGLVAAIEDFAGRTISFEYDDSQGLIGVRSPATPEYKKGRLTAYRYERADAPAPLAHALTMVMDPRGGVFLHNRYDEQGRVAAQRFGSGAWMTVQYGASAMHDDKGQGAIGRTWVTDQLGATRLYEHDTEGHLLRRWLWKNGSYKFLESFQYNEDGERTLDCLPSGRCTRFVYGSGAERGLLTEVDEYPAGKGEPRVTKFSHEPCFGRIAWVSFADGAEERFEYGDDSASNLKAIDMRAGPAAVWNMTSHYAYDAFGRPVGEQDARGVMTRYEYYPACDPDGDGIVATADRKNRTACATDSGGGYLKSIIVDAFDSSERKAAGVLKLATTSFNYDPIGNIISQTTPDGTIATFSVNALNQVVREQRSGMTPVRYSFDANDNMVRAEIEREGAPVVHSFEYDSLDLVISSNVQISASEQAITRYEYDAVGRLAGIELPEKNRVAYEYDAEGRLVCIVRGEGTLERSRECVTRNEDGEVTAFIDGSGARTEYTLNGFGEAAAKTDALGNRKEFERDAMGRVVAVRAIDANGALLAEERLEYDARLMVKRSRRLFREDSDASRWLDELFEYDAGGNLTALVDPLGNRTSVERDGLGGVLSITSPAGVRRVFARDAAGRVTASYIADGDNKLGLTEYTFNGTGKLIRMNAGWSMPRQFSYDGQGNLVAVTNPDGSLVRFDVDDLGRRIAAHNSGEEKSSEAVTRYVWNKNNNLVRLIDANNNATAFGYDPQDRLIVERFADASERRTSYDAADRVTAVLQRDNTSLLIDYDAAGRLASRYIVPAAGVIGTRQQRFAYDGLDRLIYAVDENDPEEAEDDAISRFVYDSLSRPIAELAGNRWMVRGFDDAGRLSTEQPYGGVPAYFARNADGAISSVLAGSRRIAAITRDASGNMVNADFGRGLTLELTRDSWGRQTFRRYAGAWRTLAAWKFEYDANGRVGKEDDSLFGVARVYSRDYMGRLISAIDSPSGAPEDKRQRVRRFSYDAVGNVIASEEDGAVTQMKYNSLGELTDISASSGFIASDSAAIPRALTYDANGNLLQNGEWEYRYDAFGRLTDILEDGGLMAQYKYDALGRRVGESSADVDRELIWNGWQLAAEVTSDNGMEQFVYADESALPVASLSSAGAAFFIADRSGSARAKEIQGTIRKLCDFGPYGAMERCEHGDTPFGFAGMLRGGDPELMYARNRSYDPRLMRFIQPDPLGMKIGLRTEAAVSFAPSPSYHRWQGEASTATLPNRQLSTSARYGAYPFGRAFVSSRADLNEGEPNLYLYARGDPSTFYDPLGLASLVFERANDELILYDGDDEEITRYHAANNTTRPKADPLTIGARGPVPDGTFAIGVPEFYSEEYRESFYNRFGFEGYSIGESVMTGQRWAGTWQDDYNVSQGRIRIRIGAPHDGPNRTAWNRQLFIHAGRNNRYEARTHGCIRARDDEIETLAANMIELYREEDPVTTLTVR